MAENAKRRKTAAPSYGGRRLGLIELGILLKGQGLGCLKKVIHRIALKHDMGVANSVLVTRLVDVFSYNSEGLNKPYQDFEPIVAEFVLHLIPET